MLAIFSCGYFLSAYLFCSNVLSIFSCTVCFLTIEFWVVLDILDASPLLDMRFKIFFPVFFEEQMFLILIKSDLVIFFVFMDHAFSVLRNLSLTQGHKYFFLCFLLEVLFIVFDFTFRNRISFLLILHTVWGVGLKLFIAYVFFIWLF